MALFGVPLAREDAAALAVECAVEMQKALSEFNRTRTSENQRPLEVGIGINTGTCVFGAIGSRKIRQYTVIGDTVNTASRLCSIAKPGEIICSENTMRQVKANVRAVELPKVRVKGKHDELTVYRVVGTRTPTFNPKDVTHPL